MFLKEFFEKVNFEKKNQQTITKALKIYPTYKKSYRYKTTENQLSMKFVHFAQDSLSLILYISCNYRIKSSPHAINGYVLPRENPILKTETHMLL